jgi:solute carrier family 25, member 42
MIPYAGLSFSTFERIKRVMLHRRVKLLTIESDMTDQMILDLKTSVDDEYDPVRHKHYELTVPGKLICGALTGVFAQSITYPLDVVRRYMQLDVMFKDAEIRR